MAYVPIPKDLNKVKTKVAFNLTKRQLIGFSVAGLIGIPVYLEFPQNVISKRIYCSEVPICRFFESLRMAVLKIEALE